jgi:uncharacterized membrane protein YhaH (DUF805 family)
MRGLRFFSSLEGRIGRKTFWLFSVAVLAAQFLVLFIALFVAAILLPDSSERSSAEDWWSEFVIMAGLYPQFVIDVKRGHDRNIPFWVVGVFYAAIIVRNVLSRLGWLVMSPQQAVFSARDLSSYIVILLLGIAGLALLVELGFRRGTIGPNPYGPDPLASR